jgi:hypothetical protein
MELSATNPEIAGLISTNQEEFRAWIAGAPDLPERTTITFTPEEMVVIKRIMELGFEREETMVAYLACDKNEEYTINYLFDHKGEDE